ncbi:MAG: Co2+/Mg2+ efflux protein ApaG [Bacteroidetes bacterium]|nr:Co2+/Mg2+ efflux protein ApaG [Bacteroidota bacterium]HET6245960.1 Co2+/Mg2+ efflux protein ApaG [Bacteroidia bacterium]
MITHVTQGIRISVVPEFKSEYSHPLKSHFYFSYRICVENESEFPVQLLSRHWFIFDSSGDHSEVEGEGVIGLQPVIAPGEIFEYESACNLTTDMGKMQGTYLMEHLVTGNRFYVQIPEFKMETPYKLN